MKTNYYNADTESWCLAEVVEDRGRVRDLEIPSGRVPTLLKGVPSTSAVDPARSGWSDTSPSADTEPPPSDDQEEAEEEAEEETQEAEEGVEFSSLTVAEAKEQVDSETEVDVLETWHAEEIDGKERVTLLSHIEARIDELAEE